MSNAPECIWVEPDGDTIIIHNGASNLEALIATGYLTKYIRADSAYAALAKLAEGNGLVERLNRADEYEPLGHDGWEAAAHIAALTAQLAEKEEQLVSVLQREAATHERHDAKMEAAEAERDALRERVARLEGALRHYRETLCEGFCGEDMWADEGHSHPEIQRDCGGCLAASVLLSAALTDGGKDG